MRSATLMLTIAMLAGGCTVGPDYVRPDPALPGGWQADAAIAKGVTPAESADLTEWWTQLDDPLLTGLIAEAVAGNTDLHSAEARLREARARRAYSAADRFPTLEVNGSATRTQTGEAAGGSDRTAELYAAGFDAGWELDLFGGKRRALEAATAELQASEADLHDVLVSTAAEVALNYVELRTYEQRLRVAGDNLAAQEETYDLTRWRAMAGLTTDLDVAQALYVLEQTRAALPPLRAGAAQARNRLAVLLGLNPGALVQRLAEETPIPEAPLSIAIGVPAEVIRQRPDVRGAERRLAAQTAQVGVATAARYPSFSLFGSIGLESLSADRLLTSAARTSVIGGSFATTLFDAGRLRQNVEIENALQAQAFADYRSTVLTALEDVEGALVDYANQHERRRSLQAATVAARDATALAREQYSTGLIDFQTVLDAERSRLALDDELAVSEGEAASNLIRLYKALGGGWRPLAMRVGAAAAGSEQP